MIGRDAPSASIRDQMGNQWEGVMMHLISVIKRLYRRCSDLISGYQRKSWEEMEYGKMDEAEAAMWGEMYMDSGEVKVVDVEEVPEEAQTAVERIDEALEQEGYHWADGAWHLNTGDVARGEEESV